MTNLSIESSTLKAIIISFNLIQYIQYFILINKNKRKVRLNVSENLRCTLVHLKNIYLY
jgi:hypothetical protein